MSIAVVLMVLLLMVGLSTRLLGGVQADLSAVGQHHERRVALLAAEFAVAQAQAMLIANADLFDSTSGTGWTPLLGTTRAGVAELLCQPNGSNHAPEDVPKTAPASQPQVYYTAGGGDVTWQYCIHNNAEDPAYLDPTANPPGVTGDTLDARDPQRLLVIEAWGRGPHGAVARLQVTVGSPSGTPPPPCAAMGEEQDECAQ